MRLANHSENYKRILDNARSNTAHRRSAKHRTAGKMQAYDPATAEKRSSKIRFRRGDKRTPSPRTESAFSSIMSSFAATLDKNTMRKAATCVMSAGLTLALMMSFSNIGANDVSNAPEDLGNGTVAAASANDTVKTKTEKTDSMSKKAKKKLEKKIVKKWSKIDSSDFENKSRAEKIELIGAMAHDDERLSGIPASLTAAQMICESGVLVKNSTLSKESNNYFGIKASSGGYNWKGSTWNGDYVKMKTAEYYDGHTKSIVHAKFRAYKSVFDSVRDHSAYLKNMTMGGMNGNSDTTKMYPGIASQSVEDAIDNVARWYATSDSYPNELRMIIKENNLKRFDV